MASRWETRNNWILPRGPGETILTNPLARNVAERARKHLRRAAKVQNFTDDQLAAKTHSRRLSGIIRAGIEGLQAKLIEYGKKNHCNDDSMAVLQITVSPILLILFVN